MELAPKIIYDSLNTFEDLHRLISEGESESYYLECKAPSQPKLSSDLQATLAKAISGFSNSDGGVIIWGMSTTKKLHSELDLMTQIEPIGNCKSFAAELANKIPTLTVPAIRTYEQKLIKEKPSAERGIVVTYIPPVTGDPIQSLKDELFYFRSGASFSKAPHHMIKRLFAATESPDIHCIVSAQNSEEENTAHLKFLVENRSSAIGEHVHLTLYFGQGEMINNIRYLSLWSDITDMNRNVITYDHALTQVLHRGLNLAAGEMYVTFKNRLKKPMKIFVNVYANKMRARSQTFQLSQKAKKFELMLLQETFLY